MPGTLTIGQLIAQARTAPAASVLDSPLLNRVARHPAIKMALLLQSANADIATILNNPGYRTITGLLNHPAAQQIIADSNLLYGRQTGLAGLKSLFTPGKYGVKFDSSELLPGLSDVLGIAAGHPVDAAAVTPEEAASILDGYQAREEEEETARSEVTAGNVRVAGTGNDKDPCDELCEIACGCLADRGTARTYQQCVAEELQRRYYKGRRPQGPDADGPRPEVSYKLDETGTYQPVMSRNDAAYPTSAPVVRGAPRPDVSWWKDGKLWKIFEMKFPGDGYTSAQRGGLYQVIAEDQDADLEELDVGRDCDCSTGRAKPGKC
ncbi:hypothetical protein [Rhodovulum sulfidophilum]|uniref:hypothetical protein n=1 Tax=Rhodovulum sulfidophilum TaxID=35806 RepID=UPI0019204C19|nr:hypothetical protein [Rhodovulum sulfidophilum]MBL3561125.1 hypothetical protein [Rhodovulum sulfidophilum]